MDKNRELPPPRTEVWSLTLFQKVGRCRQTFQVYYGSQQLHPLPNKISCFKFQGYFMHLECLCTRHTIRFCSICFQEIWGVERSQGNRSALPTFFSTSPVLLWNQKFFDQFARKLVTKLKGSKWSKPPSSKQHLIRQWFWGFNWAWKFPVLCMEIHRPPAFLLPEYEELNLDFNMFLS